MVAVATFLLWFGSASRRDGKEETRIRLGLGEGCSHVMVGKLIVSGVAEGNLGFEFPLHRLKK